MTTNRLAPSCGLFEENILSNMYVYIYLCVCVCIYIYIKLKNLLKVNKKNGQNQEIHISKKQYFITLYVTLSNLRT